MRSVSASRVTKATRNQGWDISLQIEYIRRPSKDDIWRRFCVIVPVFLNEGADVAWICALTNLYQTTKQRRHSEAWLYLWFMGTVLRWFLICALYNLNKTTKQGQYSTVWLYLGRKSLKIVPFAWVVDYDEFHPFLPYNDLRQYCAC